MTLKDLAMTIKWHCIEEEDDDNLDDNAMITPTYLRAITRDFLTESTSKVVEFVHVSVKEYLQDRKDGVVLEYSSEKCHELIANMFVTYLLRAEQSLVNLEERRMYSTRLTNEQENGIRMDMTTMKMTTMTMKNTKTGKTSTTQG